MIYLGAVWYIVSVSTIKFSILVSYNLIFGRLKWFRIALYATATLEAIWLIGVFIYVIFQCNPIDKSWKPLKPGHCIDFIPFLWGNSITNAVLDYVILLLPVFPVLRLQMKREQKFLLLLSFSLGSLSVLSSVIALPS